MSTGLNVLVACEFSGIVREAFRHRGHNAWSCDLLPSLDGSHYHYQMDVLELLAAGIEWDLMIAHPPCNRLLVSGALHWHKWQNSGEQQKGIVFFLQMALAKVPKVCVENPRGIMNTCWRKPDQYLQPWMFGEMESKEICLWLEGGLKPLEPTKDVYRQMMKLPKRVRERVHHESPGEKDGLTRSQRRSIFYKGIAAAMAEQWGEGLE